MHTGKIKRLLRDLQHEDSSKRKAAVEALAEGDERAVYPLLKALRDENLGVQDAAMHSLMTFKGESTAYMVLPLLREEAYLRSMGMLILREIGRDTIPLLRPLLRDKDSDIRKFALDLITEIGYCDYVDELKPILESDPNANVRAAAAKALGVLKYFAATRPLTNALHDEEWVCFSALEALTNLGDENTVDDIASLLSHPSQAIRLAALEALGKMGFHHSSEPLLSGYAQADDIEKRSIVTSLVRIGRMPPLEEVRHILVAMLNDNEWEEKMLAIRGFVLLKDESSIPSLVDLAGSLDPSEPESEDKLCHIREAIKEFGCSKWLIDVLSDEAIKYRGKVFAAELIGELKCKVAVHDLISLIKCAFRDVRRSSIKSLGKIHTAESSAYLIEAAGDHDSHVRKSAVASLGKIGEKAAFEPLITLLKDEQYDDVIEEFVRALINIDSSQFLSRIKEFDERVQAYTTRYASDIISKVTR